MLEQMARMLEDLAQERRTTLTVTVTPSFASLWLVPKLSRFRASHPAIDVHLDASEELMQLERAGFDVAIRLAAHESVPQHWKTLVRERMMIVAAPTIAQQIEQPEDLCRFPLLVFHDPRARYEWMSWLHWLKKLQLPRGEARSSFHFSQYEHLLKAAIQGLGVAIGRTPLILPLLETGSLRVVLPSLVEDGMSYHLIRSERSEHPDAVTAFTDWIQHELADESVA
jgi:DNA-binding transcriptional LysR family regulator